MSLFEPIFAALNGVRVRYVVVGGVATVPRGFARPTADLDLAIDLAPGEARRAMEAFTAIGLRSRAPVDPSGWRAGRKISPTSKPWNSF